MTRPATEVRQAQVLIADGLSDSETARKLGIPRSTIREWHTNGFWLNNDTRRESWQCRPCDHLETLCLTSYAYILGLYLGDGSISVHPRNVFRLRITLDQKYTGIIQECAGAMGAVLPNRVGLVQGKGCIAVSSYSKHWPCLLPQHGRGPKHLRLIVLEPWQQRIVFEQHPGLFLRGLIHSDGWRGTNVAVSRRYGRREYPRYQFSNRSSDIRDMFRLACESLGIACRRSSAWHVSVSRRESVAQLDSIVGLKS